MGNSKRRCFVLCRIEGMKRTVCYVNFDVKGKQREGKFPLYRCKFEEYQPNNYKFAFQITAAGQQVVIRAPTEQDMHIVNTLILQH